MIEYRRQNCHSAKRCWSNLINALTQEEKVRILKLLRLVDETIRNITARYRKCSVLNFL